MFQKGHPYDRSQKKRSVIQNYLWMETWYLMQILYVGEPFQSPERLSMHIYSSDRMIFPKSLPPQSRNLQG